MGVAEGISLVFVLLLSLYGCAQAITGLARVFVRPSKTELKLVLTLKNDEETEQQIRFAKMLSKEWKIPLEAECTEADGDTVQIARVLLNEKNLTVRSCTDCEGRV